jgi:C4-dicarboxylate-specific signal transduction histidine kinase
VNRRETIALVAHDLQARQVEVNVNMPSQPCVINGDQVLLQQVFVNLVMNAVDAMVTTPPGSRRVTISALRTAGHVAIAVRDSGSGLPPEIDGRLFAPFVTTKSQGMVIGLTIAQTIVQTHRGTIEAVNNPDGGATFTSRSRSLMRLWQPGYTKDPCLRDGGSGCCGRRG